MQEQSPNVGALIRSARTAQGISALELAQRTGIADTSIGRIERGDIAAPRPDLLKSLADALDLELADLYAAAGYVQPTGLPTFAPYLRSKYADLPDEARDELEASFARIATKHGYDPAGPAAGEDEHE